MSPKTDLSKVDLSLYDSSPGCFPLRAKKTPEERVLHVHLATEDEPQPSMVKALQGLGPYAAKVPWRQHSFSARQEMLLRRAKMIEPTLVFMQLQTDRVVDPQTFKELRNIAPQALLVSWCGDVGRSAEWSMKLGEHVDLLCFTSTDQVEAHRDAGFQSAYLQIGYDEEWHYEAEGSSKSEIVFFGQNYCDEVWAPFIPDHEADLRRQACLILRAKFGMGGFRLFGSGWPKGFAEPPLKPKESADIYRESKMALSISLTSKLGRYSSDRLLRALACGPAVLVKRFKDMGSWGLVGGENCLIWNSTASCLDVAKSWFGVRSHDLEQIGQAGAELARTHHTWPVRMRELGVYLAVLRGQEPELERL